jgi:hypothetical protein
MNSAHRAYTATTYVWRAKTPPESGAQMCPLAALRRDINNYCLGGGAAAIAAIAYSLLTPEERRHTAKLGVLIGVLGRRDPVSTCS